MIFLIKQNLVLGRTVRFSLFLYFFGFNPTHVGNRLKVCIGIFRIMSDSKIHQEHLLLKEGGLPFR